MSNKTTEENKRPVVVIRPGRRNGKAITQAFVEAINEMSVDPPATAAEAEAFCRIQIKRCNMNLANAKDRGDKRAVLNLERKIAVYRYLYDLVRDRRDCEKSPKVCPYCQVFAVGIDGICSCCGKKIPEQENHGRLKTTFAKIIVSGKSSKPYYEILYFDPTDNQYHIGFGSYFLDYVFNWLEEEFEITNEEANSWLTFPANGKGE